MRNQILHGGDVADLLSRHPDAPRPLIDLSTGINPWPYPADIAEEALTRLPQRATEEACRDAMAAYLSTRPESILLTPGTQIAISLLPFLIKKSRIDIAVPTYGEHAPGWKAAGHEVKETPRGKIQDEDADILILTNPNNPDGAETIPAALHALAKRQAERGGFLILDEAFADVSSHLSLAAHAGEEGLIILRSFGKFFGLAGLRLGGVLAPPAILEKLKAALGPWPVSGPALAVGAAAYGDADWISATRDKLKDEAAGLDSILDRAGLHVIGGTPLFRLAAHPAAQTVHTRLADAGLHVRRFEYDKTWLRFGLPPDAAAKERLIAAL